MIAELSEAIWQKNNYYKEPVVVFMKKHPHAITAFYGCVYGAAIMCL